MNETQKMGMVRSLKYTIQTIWEADRGTVLYAFYKNCTEAVFNTIYFIYQIQYIYSAIEAGGSFEGLVRIVLLFACLHIVIHLASAGYAYYIRLRTPKIYGHVFRKVIKKSTSIELARYEQPDFYDKFSKALDECLTNAIVGLQNFAQAVGYFLAALVGLYLVARVDPMLLVFIVPPVTTSFWIGSKLNALQYQLREEETRDKRITEYVKRVFYEKKYASELRLYPIKELLFQKHASSYEKRFEIHRRISKKISWYSFLQTSVFLGLTTMLAYIYVTVVLKSTGVAKIGAYIAILSSTNYICRRVTKTITYMNRAGKDCMYMNNLKDFLNYQPREYYSGKQNVEKPLGNIDMEHVTFTYTGAKRPVIQDLSLHINQGEKIALVGENGAGKTTLIKLLMGLYPLEEGTIKIDGIPIQEFDQKEFHQHFGTVFQDLQIFALPLSHNVLMREPKNEEERELVKESLIKAQFGDKLKTLPNGIDTILTKEFDEEGFVCSGGQAQKIAIARVFAKNPDIVILDEPSSALDPIAEYRMYDNMLHASEEKRYSSYPIVCPQLELLTESSIWSKDRLWNRVVMMN